jgi:hypothetical protein
LQGGAEWEDPETYQSKALARTEEQIGIETMTEAKIVQYYSLYCIYNATNGVPNVYTIDAGFVGTWFFTANWETNDVDPCANWHGIVCENDQVTEIDLHQNGLNGAFPPEVTLLASDGLRATGAGSLAVLDLFNNEFLFNNFDNSWMTLLGSSMGKWRFQIIYTSCAAL